MVYQLLPIKKKKVFEFLFENGKWFKEGNLKAVVYPRESYRLEESTIKVYYAVNVSKKVSKKSVVRNRIKRLLRESLRKTAKIDMEDSFVRFQYIFLNWIQAPNRPCEIRLADVYPTVRKILFNAYDYFKDLSVGVQN